MQEPYLRFLFDHPTIPALAMLYFFLLGLARILPIVIIPPFFGSRSIPTRARLSLAIFLTAIFMPQIVASARLPLVPSSWSFSASLIKEFFIGLLLAYLAAVPFYIARSSGIIVDSMRGSSAMIGQDPLTRNQTSILGTLFTQVTIFIFFMIDGPHIFIHGLLLSYRLLPQDLVFAPSFFVQSHPFWQQIVGLTAYLFAVAIQLAAPALVGCLMAEVFLGIANRLAPQIQIAFLGMSIKSLLAIALLWLGWLLIIKQIQLQSLQWLEQLQRYLELLASS